MLRADDLAQTPDGRLLARTPVGCERAQRLVNDVMLLSWFRLVTILTDLMIFSICKLDLVLKPVRRFCQTDFGMLSNLVQANCSKKS